MKGLVPFLLVAGLLLGACAVTAEPTAIGSSGAESEPAASPTPIDTDTTLAREAQAFAEMQGISLEDALRRLEFQESIGNVQATMINDLAGTFGGLWVEHSPDYRIVIALTDGNEANIRPYIEGKPWSSFVTVQQVEYTLAELLAGQEAATQAAAQVNVSVTSAVDVVGNRVELVVGNPELLLADLEAANLTLPEMVEVKPALPGEPLPNSNQGVLFDAMTSDGRTIYLPKQPPTNVSMAALLEGTLVEVAGCLRVSTEGFDEGFFVLWPNDSDIRVNDEAIEVLNGEMQIIARVGDPVRLGGGAMESSSRMEGNDQLIPGLPLENCPGPYWVAGPLETLAQQAVPDIYTNPFSSGGRILAIIVNQSRPSTGEETLSGELMVDEQGCMRVGDHTILWPPNTFLREDPLRLIYERDGVAQIGDVINITGEVKTAQDYRYFENKVRCPGPYWGANEVSSP
jgi:hypothetical protein